MKNPLDLKQNSTSGSNTNSTPKALCAQPKNFKGGMLGLLLPTSRKTFLDKQKDHTTNSWGFPPQHPPCNTFVEENFEGGEGVGKGKPNNTPFNVFSEENFSGGASCG